MTSIIPLAYAEKLKRGELGCSINVQLDGIDIERFREIVTEIVEESKKMDELK